MARVLPVICVLLKIGPWHSSLSGGVSLLPPWIQADLCSCPHEWPETSETMWLSRLSCQIPMTSVSSPRMLALLASRHAVRKHKQAPEKSVEKEPNSPGSRSWLSSQSMGSTSFQAWMYERHLDSDPSSLQWSSPLAQQTRHGIEMGYSRPALLKMKSCEQNKWLLFFSSLNLGVLFCSSKLCSSFKSIVVWALDWVPCSGVGDVSREWAKELIFICQAPPRHCHLPYLLFPKLIPWRMNCYFWFAGEGAGSWRGQFLAHLTLTSPGDMWGIGT